MRRGNGIGAEWKGEGGERGRPGGRGIEEEREEKK